jgi:hypothetical protein
MLIRAEVYHAHLVNATITIKIIEKNGGNFRATVRHIIIIIGNTNNSLRQYQLKNSYFQHNNSIFNTDNRIGRLLFNMDILPVISRGVQEVFEYFFAYWNIFFEKDKNTSPKIVDAAF